MIEVIEPWWGEFELPENQWCLWSISLLRFHARRTRNEWHFAWQRQDDPLEAAVRWAIPATTEPNLENAEQSRFVLMNTTRQLTLRACLADRPVIARPEVPLFVPPGENVCLYVSTNVWLQACIGSRIACELPIYRLSDTWFGPNTRQGELCYASLTRARTIEREPQVYPHRAVTPVQVINEAADALQIVQIRVPVNLLSLHAAESGPLLTDAVTLRRGAADDQATLEIRADVGERGGHRELLAEPREQAAQGTIVEAFTRLFG